MRKLLFIIIPFTLFSCSSLGLKNNKSVTFNLSSQQNSECLFDSQKSLNYSSDIGSGIISLSYSFVQSSEIQNDVYSANYELKNCKMYIAGEKDKLIPLETIQFFSRLINNDFIYNRNTNNIEPKNLLGSFTKNVNLLNNGSNNINETIFINESIFKQYGPGLNAKLLHEWKDIYGYFDKKTFTLGKEYTIKDNYYFIISEYILPIELIFMINKSINDDTYVVFMKSSGTDTEHNIRYNISMSLQTTDSLSLVKYDYYEYFQLVESNGKRKLFEYTSSIKRNNTQIGLPLSTTNPSQDIFPRSSSPSKDDFGINQNYTDGCRNQLEKANNALKEYERANDKMEIILKTIEEKYKDNPTLLAKLNTSQSTWKQYVKDYINSIWIFDSNAKPSGIIYYNEKMNIELAEITFDRAKYLNRWLDDNYSGIGSYGVFSE